MKVYKYRGIEFFNRDVETLAKSKIYASTFDKLNDPFEGIFDDQVSALITFFEKTFKVDGTEVRERLKAIIDYKSTLGIYSLSKCSKNELLWAHYAHSHTGFCIEYELKGLKENYLIPHTVNELEVDYKKTPHPIFPQDFKKTELFLRKLFATKSKGWKYENEIRLIFDKFGFKDYHPSTLTGIYFGAEMEEENRKLLIDSLTNLDVKFYEIYRKKDSYELSDRLVHVNHRILKNDLLQFDYNIIKHIEERTIENFYIWFKGSEYNQELLETFSAAFREKYAKKKSNLFIFKDDSVSPLIQKYPLTESEEKIYDDLLIGHSFSSDKGYSLIFFE
jgi:hypothetical protein